jgi:hypothetical protein
MRRACAVPPDHAPVSSRGNGEHYAPERWRGPRPIGSSRHPEYEAASDASITPTSENAMSTERFHVRTLRRPAPLRTPQHASPSTPAAPRCASNAPGPGPTSSPPHSSASPHFRRPPADPAPGPDEHHRHPRHAEPLDTPAHTRAQRPPATTRNRYTAPTQRSPTFPNGDHQKSPPPSPQPTRPPPHARSGTFL